MVLPPIPVALIAVGAITGGSGIALGGKGAWDLKKAQGEFSKSKGMYERRRKRLAPMAPSYGEALTSEATVGADTMRRRFDFVSHLSSLRASAFPAGSIALLGDCRLRLAHRAPA